jgi:transketolase
MALAPIAYLLWTKVMKYNPKDPEWISRDRFVLSNGHACALLYWCGRACVCVRVCVRMLCACVCVFVCA